MSIFLFVAVIMKTNPSKFAYMGILALLKNLQLWHLSKDVYYV